MKRIALAALAAAVLISPASAFDRWNGSGFPLDHNFHNRFEFNLGVGGGYPRGNEIGPGARIISVPDYTPVGQDVEAVQAEGEARRARALANHVAAQRRLCAPVVLYTDEGVIAHPANGCVR